MHPPGRQNNMTAVQYSLIQTIKKGPDLLKRGSGVLEDRLYVIKLKSNTSALEENGQCIVSTMFLCRMHQNMPKDLQN